MEITADITKILKNDLTFTQSDLIFIYDVFPELHIGFVSFLVILALENVVSFTKTCFYQKQNSITIPNYVETFHANVLHNLT